MSPETWGAIKITTKSCFTQISLTVDCVKVAWLTDIFIFLQFSNSALLEKQLPVIVIITRLKLSFLAVGKNNKTSKHSNIHSSH